MGCTYHEHCQAAQHPRLTFFCTRATAVAYLRNSFWIRPWGNSKELISCSTPKMYHPWKGLKLASLKASSQKEAKNRQKFKCNLGLSRPFTFWLWSQVFYTLINMEAAVLQIGRGNITHHLSWARLHVGKNNILEWNEKDEGIYAYLSVGI